MIKFLSRADPGKWCQFPGITAKVKYLSPELEKIEMRSVFYSWILNWDTSPLLCRAPVDSVTINRSMQRKESCCVINDRQSSHLV